jgi:uncharacterized protein (TIGR03083 family)
MSTQSQQRTDRPEARRGALDRVTAMQLASVEYVRVADLLAGLSPDQWSLPTDCPGWDVRAVAGHMLGMVQMVASFAELARQQAGATRRANRDGGLLVDALTAIQVDKNAGLSQTELVAELRRLGPRAVRNRRRVPAVLRNRTMEDETDGRWTYGFLFDVILTRDPFMHRIDITRAVGTAMIAAAEHEGVIVDDVVREWLRRHGEPVSLHLSGPAGGRWSQGEVEGERIEMEPFEFCRALSGRGSATGLLATQVPF